MSKFVRLWNNTIKSEMEEMSFKIQSDMDGILVDYAKKGYTVEYIGEADVEGPVHGWANPGLESSVRECSATGNGDH